MEGSTKAELIAISAVLAVLMTIGTVSLYWATDYSPVFESVSPPNPLPAFVGDDQFFVQWKYIKHRDCGGAGVMMAEHIDSQKRYTLREHLFLGWQGTSNGHDRIEEATVAYPILPDMAAGEYLLKITLDYECNPFDMPPPQYLTVGFVLDDKPGDSAGSD